MSRKSLIMCLGALGAMLLAMVIAIAVLYHDGDKKDQKVEPRYGLFQAVPSDAVAIMIQHSYGDNHCQKHGA